MANEPPRINGDEYSKGLSSDNEEGLPKFVGGSWGATLFNPTKGISPRGLSTAVANDRREGVFLPSFELLLFLDGGTRDGASIAICRLCSLRVPQYAGQSHGRYNGSL